MSKKLLTKKVPFQGKSLTMYSIDGITWSTRSEELQSILDRHSREQAGFSADLKGEEKEKTPQPKPKPKKFNRVHDDAEIDEAIDDDMNEEEDVFEDEGANEDLDLLEETVGSKGKKASAVKPAVAKAAVKPKPVITAKKPLTKPAAKPAAKVPQKKAPPKPAKKPAKPAAKIKPKAAPAKAKPKKKK